MTGGAASSKAPTRTRRLLGLAAALAASVACPAGAQSQEADPWQSLNRRTFALNEWLDMHLLIPIAKGWDFVAPDPVQTGIANVYETADVSIVLLNDILQLKPVAAGQDLARFVVNVTAGIGGIFDVATKLDIPQNDEDFGQTLGYWGCPPGPYLVLPIFGPSNPRDTVGLLADTASQPWTYFVDWYVSVPVSVFEFVNLRTIYLEDVEEMREAALDYYVFQRNAYVQSRDLAVKDLESFEEETEEDLSDFDDEDEEE